MKKLNSLEELGTLMPDGFKTKKPFEIDNSFSKKWERIVKKIGFRDDSVSFL